MDNTAVSTISNPMIGEPVSRGTVLVVDDSRDTRKVLRMALEIAGYSVSLAENGMEALEMLRTQPQDLLLTDLWMPNMDGAELVRLVRQMPECAATQIVMMSASLPQELRGAVPVDAFMLKPFEFEPMLKLLSQLRPTSSTQPASNDAHRDASPQQPVHNAAM